MIQNCNDQLLDDVIRVDIVLASTCDIEVPFAVPGETVTMGTKTVGGQTVDRIGPSVLGLAFDTKDSDQGEIASAPSLKQPEKITAVGIVVNHDLQVPISAGFEEVKAALPSVQLKDIHVVLTTAAGTRYLLYSVPGSSSVLMDEQDVNQSATLKVTMQSMSHVIKLI